MGPKPFFGARTSFQIPLTTPSHAVGGGGISLGGKTLGSVVGIGKDSGIVHTELPRRSITCKSPADSGKPAAPNTFTATFWLGSPSGEAAGEAEPV